MSLPKVIGLDLSLTGTGVAGHGWSDTITSRPRRARENKAEYVHHRLHDLEQAIYSFTTGANLVVIEGLSFGGYDTDRQLAGLSWMTRHGLWSRSIPFAMVPPSNLKQYATGAGNASKERVTAAVRGWRPGFDGDDNAADAIALHAMGCDWLGQPAVAAAEAHRAALTACEWPDMDLLVVAT